MIRYARDFRLIPVVLLATICLFALKVSGLVFDGGYTLAERLQGLNKPAMQITSAESVPDYPKIVVADEQAAPPVSALPASKRSWAQQMFNYGDNGDITGSVGGEEKSSGPPLKASSKPPDPPKLEVGSLTVPLEAGRIASAGERAILGRLQDRSKELDIRGRELEMRESLLKATEKRLDAKVAELKDAEARVNTAMGNRDKAEAAPSPSSKHGSKPKARHPTGDARNGNAGSSRCFRPHSRDGGHTPVTDHRGFGKLSPYCSS